MNRLVLHLSKRLSAPSRKWIPTTFGRGGTAWRSSLAAASHGSDISSLHPTKETQDLLEGLCLFENVEDPVESQRLRMKRRMALARAITLVESKAPSHQGQADWLLTNLLERNASEKSFRLGLAGPPGAGKSTFIESFGTLLLDKLRSEQHETPSKLAVLCIDPSSNLTGGSILGDKTRMMELARHDRAFVRPSANGGTFGGLSAYTDDAVSLCQAAGYDLVVVESVGLGQSEVEIAESVDMLVLMVPPGGGDELQGVKKGIVEVADMLVVNKADGDLLPAARSTAADYRGAMKYLRTRTEGWSTPVLLASAHTGDGLPLVWEKILEFRALLTESGALEEKRRQQSSYWMWKHLKDLISRKTQSDRELRATAQAMEQGLKDGTITPRVAALNLLERLLQSSGGGGLKF